MTVTEPTDDVTEAEVVDTPEVHHEVVPYEPAPLEVPAPGTLPGQADLLALAQLANTFAGAELVPKPLQGKPADVLLVLLTARDLGLPATVALRECHPIDGRVTVSPKLKLAIVRERHLGRVWPDQANDLHEHTWYASRHDDPETVYRATYSWEDAQRANLVSRACTPTEHKMTNGKCSCKSNWRTYPGQMLQWRAMGYLMDQAFGEVGTGLYGADELGAITDEEGHIIDVAEVGNLPGMEVPEVEAPPPPPPADPDALWDLQVRIRALPDEQRTKMAERWKDSGRLTYERDGNRHPFRPTELPASAVSSAESMVTGFERIAAKGEGWNPADARAAVEHEVAVRLCGLLVPLVALTPDGATDPGEVQEGAQQAPIPPDLSYSPEALRDAEAAVAEMTDMEVEDFLRAEGVPIVGKSARDRAHLAAVLAAKAEPTTE